MTKRYPTTSRPIERAVPETVLIADSSDSVFRSGIFKRAANIAKGSAEPNKNKVGTVTAKQVEDIAKLKMPDLNTDSLESAIKTVAGTARSMGLDVVG